MNRKLIPLLSFLLMLTLVLSGCNLIKVDRSGDDQTVVAEFNGGTILKGDAMAQFNEVMEYYKSYGQELTDQATIDSIKQDLLAMMAQEAIVRVKADEMGLTTVSDDERADITAEITASFNDALDYYAEYFPEATPEESRQKAIEFLAEQGYTLEGEIEYAIENTWQNKLFEQVTKDVVADEESIQAAYDLMVEEAKEIYENSPYDFEYDVLSGEKVAWIPENCRAIKQILLMFTDEQAEQLSDLVIELDDINYQLEGGEEEGDLLFDEDEHEHYEGDGHDHGDLVLETDGETPVVADPEPADLPDEDFDDTDDPVMTPEELLAKQAELTAQIETMKAQFAATLKPKVDEIMAKIAAGADFDQLIDEYGEDYFMTEEPTKSQGYYVTPDSEMQEPEFTQAAMALQNVGDISEPVISTMGAHILLYYADVPAGPVPLDQLRDAVTEAALSDAKEALYEQTIEEWTAAANIKTYVDRMK